MKSKNKLKKDLHIKNIRLTFVAQFESNSQ